MVLGDEFLLIRLSWKYNITVPSASIKDIWELNCCEKYSRGWCSCEHKKNFLHTNQSWFKIIHVLLPYIDYMSVWLSQFTLAIYNHLFIKHTSFALNICTLWSVVFFYLHGTRTKGVFCSQPIQTPAKKFPQNPLHIVPKWHIGQSWLWVVFWVQPNHQEKYPKPLNTATRTN